MFATSLANGMRLLASFSIEHPALSNRALAERSGLSKASVSRLTYTLCTLGFLRFDPQTRHYRLGSATLAMGYPLLGSLSIRHLALPFMQALADAMRGSVSLAMRDRYSMVYVETCRGHEAEAFRPDIGGTLPIWATAAGRGWLAGVTPALRDEVLRQIRQEYPQAWRAHGHTIRESLKNFAARGFCIACGEWQRDVHAVSVPVRLAIDGEILVFNCGVRAVLLRPGQIEQVIGPRLVRMVRAVEQAWTQQRSSIGPEAPAATAALAGQESP
jgi:DNA-binding IclR family transcriptional regulator